MSGTGKILIILIFGCFVFPGCIAVSRRKCVCRPCHPCHPCPRGERKSECQITPADFADEQMVIEEIDGVKTLSFDNNRIKRYKAIAQRPDLTPNVQVHLVRAFCHYLPFDNDRYECLVVLIHNPCFSCLAREEILNSLKYLPFDKQRVGIMEEMDKRGPCVRFVEPNVFKTI